MHDEFCASDFAAPVFYQIKHGQNVETEYKSSKGKSNFKQSVNSENDIYLPVKPDRLKKPQRHLQVAQNVRLEQFGNLETLSPKSN